MPPYVNLIRANFLVWTFFAVSYSKPALGKIIVNFEYPILILHNRGHASVVSFTYLMGKETQRPYRKLKHKVRLFGGGNDRVNLVFNALLGTSK